MTTQRGENMLKAGCAAALLASLLITGASAQSAPSLEDSFRAPPTSVRPLVWWHWMNGNITKDGIRKDMEWMQRAGLGGMQNFDAALMTPQVVQSRLAYMTPEWKDAFRYAVGLADSKGFEFGIAASPGWSETGGPWVAPKDGMKKLVWSEVDVAGGKRFNAALPPLPNIAGPYQNLPVTPGFVALEGPPKPGPVFSADAVVLAIPVAKIAAPPAPVYSSLVGGGKLAAGALQIARGTVQQPGGVLIEYKTPQTIRSAQIYIEGGGGGLGGEDLSPTLEVADASGAWRTLVDITDAAVPTTLSFAPVTAQKFRLVMRQAPGGPPVFLQGAEPGVAPPDFLGAPPSAPPPYKVATLNLMAEPRVNAAEAKAGFSLSRDYYALDGEVGPEVAGIAPSAVIDLTSKLSADGRLDWTPPAGRWKILRLGYSLTGTTNHPATAEATGLEVDKFDGDAVRRYLETYIAMYADAAGPDMLGKRGVKAMLTDSIEVGPSNWTPRILEQFQRLRGYDARPFLPALTGVIVGSRQQSDAFLYDFRRTLADLMASEHYGQVAKVAHEHGLKVYGEALEDNRPTLGDDMSMRSHADIPMAAMWTYQRARGPQPSYLADIKGGASVAHIYGQNLLAAESLTAAMSPWAFAPADLKPTMDLEMVTGVNRPIIHTSVHQPLDKPPGLTLAIFGQYFNRHETWAEMARPWIDYISRSSFMLQQGRYFADVGYFYGEEGPITGLYGEHPVADAPKRYAYDFVSADALVGKLRVDNGDLVADSGARYRVLYLGGASARLSLPTLKKLAALVEAGAIIVGRAPKDSPSLKDDAADHTALVKRLWSGAQTTNVGRGRVIASGDIEVTLAAIGVAPDFTFTGAADANVLFLHRKLADGDAYFLSNRMTRAERVEAKFRVTGKVPEIWRADTGASAPVSYRIEGGQTIVPLDMAADDALFVVFRKPAHANALTVKAPTRQVVADIGGAWDVKFQAERGAPARARLSALTPLNENADPGIKYFSGVATYATSFSLPRGAKPGKPLFLDLGKVGDVAEVVVNGKPVATAWKAPYRLDIGAATKSGANRLEVRVANLWKNRLIGDAQPGATKIAFTITSTYAPSAPLRASGLIGPVTLEIER